MWMSEKHLQVTAVSRVGVRLSLLLAKRQTGSEFVEAQCLLLTFWLFGILGNRICKQPCIPNDTLLQTTRLTFPCCHTTASCLGLLSFDVIWAEQSWPISWGLKPKNARLKSCLFVCIKETPSSELSLALAFTCLSFWPCGKQALKFWSTLLPTDLLTFWDPRNIAFPGSLAYPKTGRWRPHAAPDLSMLLFHSPQNLSLLPSQLGDLLATWACVAQNGSTEELFVCDSCLYSVGICICQCGLGFWDQWISHFQAALRSLKPITWNNMPDFFLLQFHSL